MKRRFGGERQWPVSVSRCIATTKAGARCKRRGEYGRCAAHRLKTVAEEMAEERAKLGGPTPHATGSHAARGSEMTEPKNTERRRRLFGARVRARRLEIGMDQGALARRIGVTRPEVANVEAGRGWVATFRLVALSAALQCSADELLGRRARA